MAKAKDCKSKLINIPNEDYDRLTDRAEEKEVSVSHVIIEDIKTGNENTAKSG